MSTEAVLAAVEAIREELREERKEIAALRTELLSGQDALRCEMRADLVRLQEHVDARIDAIERMVHRITDDHNALNAMARSNADRVSRLEAEVVILKSLREELEALSRKVRALDRDVSDADAASRLRDSQHEVETADVVKAMRLTVDNLTKATEDALRRTQEVTSSAEKREQQAQAEVVKLQAQAADVAKLAASVRNDSWRKQVATMAIVIITGAVGAAFSRCDHNGAPPAAHEDSP